MERVQNTILLHGVAYVQRWIAPDRVGKKPGFFVINRKKTVFWFKPGFFGFYGFNGFYGFFSVCIFL